MQTIIRWVPCGHGYLRISRVINPVQTKAQHAHLSGLMFFTFSAFNGKSEILICCFPFSWDWIIVVLTLCNRTHYPSFCGPQSQLDAMKLNRLHAATMAPTPSHIKPREEKGEVRPHQRARRTSSDDISRPKSAALENRITTIPELTESVERRLCLRDKKNMSPVSRSVRKLMKI